MRVVPIEDSLPGEHVVSVHPVMSPDAKSQLAPPSQLCTRAGRSVISR